MIESDELALKYNQLSNDILNFDLIDKLSGETHNIGFSLKWYKGYEQEIGTDTQKSGAYIFRPEQGQYFSETYASIKQVSYFDCAVKDMFVVAMEGTEGDANIFVSIEDLPVLKFEVELGSIVKNVNGHEVTVNFHSQLDNQGVFYTDSNGLEMMRRELNYRPTWDL